MELGIESEESKIPSHFSFLCEQLICSWSFLFLPLAKINVMFLFKLTEYFEESKTVSFYFFFSISPIYYYYFFLLYSMVTQLHLHVYIVFSHIIMLHCNGLNIVPSATQQDLIANPFQSQQSASINPKLPIHPTPSPTPLATTSLFSKPMIFCGKVHLCYILGSRYKCYHMVFVFLFLTYFTQYENL